MVGTATPPAMTTKAKPKDKVPTAEMVFNSFMNNPALVANALTTRRELLTRMLDPRRDINEECGYPDELTDDHYRTMYDREMGYRVVSIYPEECWKRLPRIYEDEDPDITTEFEKALDALDKKKHLIHYLQKADELSGIGQYGVILWGLSDGKPLNEAVEGAERWEEATGAEATGAGNLTLLYIRVLDSSLVRVGQYEADPTNPRFGLPTMYSLKFNDPRNMENGATVSSPSLVETNVHWTRISHIADNRKTSEVLGVPRMQPVYNRLYDLRKILGGNGEMFWRGGFPGISLETQAGMEDVEMDEDRTREMMYNYMNGLQRYLATTGMTAKSLTPQISEPTQSFEAQVKAICITLGVPFRVFMGIEEGVVSGDQATKAWDGRLANRQARYITPMVIDPVIQRLIDYGVLPPTAEPRGWTVEWPDLSAPGEEEKAGIATKRTEALAKYVGGGVDTLIPPMEFLTLICGFDDETAEAIMKAAVEHIEDIDNEELVPGRLPAPPELEVVPPPGGAPAKPKAAPTKPKAPPKPKA